MVKIKKLLLKKAVIIQQSFLIIVLTFIRVFRSQLNHSHFRVPKILTRAAKS